MWFTGLVKTNYTSLGKPFLLEFAFSYLQKWYIPTCKVLCHIIFVKRQENILLQAF